MVLKQDRLDIGEARVQALFEYVELAALAVEFEEHWAGAKVLHDVIETHHADGRPTRVLEEEGRLTRGGRVAHKVCMPVAPGYREFMNLPSDSVFGKVATKEVGCRRRWLVADDSGTWKRSMKGK